MFFLSVQENTGNCNSALYIKSEAEQHCRFRALADSHRVELNVQIHTRPRGQGKDLVAPP